MKTRFSVVLYLSNAFDSFVQISVLMTFHTCNSEKVMHPDVYLSLDETLYPTRVGVAFRQYNKEKPAKYGMLFRSINSAEVPYTYTSIIYAGKPLDVPGPYYVQNNT